MVTERGRLYRWIRSHQWVRTHWKGGGEYQAMWRMQHPNAPHTRRYNALYKELENKEAMYRREIMKEEMIS